MSENESYQAIQCQIYDYIEIACMRQYRLYIELKSGSSIRAKAINTQIIDKEEFLVVKLEKNFETEQTQEIRLDLIKSITALDENTDFKTIDID